MAKKAASLAGQLVFLSADQQAFTEQQLKLLAAIDAEGSITAAAKAVGISYKTAWDRIDNMNNLSPRPLVSRSAGGARGGGSRLTELGRQIVDGFTAMQGEHAAFVSRLGDQVHSMADLAGFVQGNALRSSARNQYRGVISGLTRGAVNVEVSLSIGDSLSLTAVITKDSFENMGFAEGSPAIALIKSSWVLLSRDLAIASSARNKLVGTVSRINKGKVNSEVVLDLGTGKSICAVITNGSVTELGLRTGVPACAIFKASSVILMAT